MAGLTLTDSGTYTGALDFSVLSGTDTLQAFFDSGGGTTSGLSAATLGTSLSVSGYHATTMMVFTGDAGANVVDGTINHDDGMSLYDGGAPTYPHLVAGSPAPTVDIPTAFTGLTGKWQLIYVEANGLPAVLSVDVARSGALNPVPLPAALPLLASGLGLLGFGGWRSRRRNSAVSTA